MMTIKKYEIFAFLVAALFFVVGLGMWIAFWPIFNSELRANYKLQANADGSLKYAAFLYANPPMKNVMKFNLFNVTNPDEVKYFGAMPELIEVGGYGFLESEQKKYYDFSSDKTQMFYQNYKQYHYSPEDLDEGFSYDDNVLFANSIGEGAVATIFGPQSEFSETAQLIASIGLVMVGEYPFMSIQKSQRRVIRRLFRSIVTIMGYGEQLNYIPDMRTFAYLSGYNNSYDENYWINTGYEDFSKLGFVGSWAGLKELPASFWPTEEARKIKGPDSGSLSKLHLTKDDELPFFLSFMCRSFKRTYWQENMVDGIKTMAFAVPHNEFDTTLEENAGFRYKNSENVDYFPEWCNEKTSSNSSTDCRKTANGTYLLPPGLFPLVCYPGHNAQPPFTVLVSPPHFLYSPPEVQHKLSGMSPDPQKHKPMVFHQEKTSGTALQVDVRFQVNLPVVNNKKTIMSSQMPNVIIPLFYEDSHAVLKDFVMNTVWLGVIIVPRIIEYLKFVLIFISIVILAVLLVIRARVKGTVTVV
ncbi:Protein CBR-SCAV-5 [Caenorhabditis briggsae]|uniref:Protein CBR-SCAV-5 n=1 Tax=Caenorhabditis briggsae TaxID=6238 RepID=A8WRJ8_CAEBR|nr:Protein CBR-SCAV-5 [Caenorhabditis briggsae]CAP23106.2 Protein CBR-SCAV-5 [Caenorhabditis briggsae]